MDKEFFVRELEGCSGTLYRVAWTILRNDDACRDALQDTALRAWEKRHTLREERYFRTWVTRILINVCRDARRRWQRTVPVGEVPLAAREAPDPALSLALQSLPERLRLPLVLHCAEGMSYQEVADALHLPLATVRGRIHRARIELRKELSEQ